MLIDNMKLVVGSLTSRRLRSWLTLIGVFIGIAAVVSLIGLGEGLRNAITSQFGFLGTDILSIQAAGMNNRGPPGTYVVNPLSNKLVDKIEKINNVDAAVNRYIKGAVLEFNNRQEIGFVVSVPGKEKRKVVETAQKFNMVEGRKLKDEDNKKVVLGNDFTNDNMFGKPLAVGNRILINNVAFEVVGILEKKGSFIIDNSVIMNEIALLDLFGDDGSVSTISVKVKDVSRIDQTKMDIEKFLRRERDVKEGEEDFSVDSPQKMLESLNSTLFAIQIFVYIIAGISIVVGGIGITNTMYTSVLERTRDIGIMKSVGAKNSTIFTLFFLEAGFFGMVGGIVGVVIGIIFAYGLSFLGRILLGSDLIQARVTPELAAGAILFSFIVGVIAGLVPAYNASKMQPVEALRYEK